MFIKLYHVSRIKNRESILKYGLILFGHEDKECNWKEMRYGKRLFVSTVFDDPWALDFTDYEGVDRWQFTVLKKHLNRDRASKAKHHYCITRRIPPGALGLAKSIDYWKIDWEKIQTVQLAA